MAKAEASAFKARVDAAEADVAALKDRAEAADAAYNQMRTFICSSNPSADFCGN